CERRTLMLRWQRAVDIVPGSEPLRWRRDDVAQDLAPEPSDPLGLCAVERDLELLDRRHRSTIVTRPQPSRRGPMAGGGESAGSSPRGGGCGDAARTEHFGGRMGGASRV